METEGSLPCSQQPATGPYIELHESSPHLPHSISVRSIPVLSFHLRLGLPCGLFPSSFQPKYCMHFSHLPRVLHALSMSYSLI